MKSAGRALQGQRMGGEKGAVGKWGPRKGVGSIVGPQSHSFVFIH